MHKRRVDFWRHFNEAEAERRRHPDVKPIGKIGNTGAEVKQECLDELMHDITRIINEPRKPEDQIEDEEEQFRRLLEHWLFDKVEFVEQGNDGHKLLATGIKSDLISHSVEKMLLQL